MTSHEFYVMYLEPNIERIEKMSEFKKYRRTNIAEMRDLNIEEKMVCLVDASVSSEDKLLPTAEFREGRIARNPENHKDQWYVAKKYFEDNFELVE